jgi:hypothetical protein
MLDVFHFSQERASHAADCAHSGAVHAGVRFRRHNLAQGGRTDHHATPFAHAAARTVDVLQRDVCPVDPSADTLQGGCQAAFDFVSQRRAEMHTVRSQSQLHCVGSWLRLVR